MFYGERDFKDMNVGGRINPTRKADLHPDAHLWDSPESHRALVARLTAEYDGWAIAMAPDNLRHYLQWVDDDVRIAVWHDPQVMPTGQHPRRKWEPVLVKRPQGRRRTSDVPNPIGDVLTCPHGASSFAGAKPRQWTRWVLDMLGYRDGDTVDDPFHGSGAVAAEVAQTVLNIGDTS
jgi:hypothetical protein